MNQEPMIPIPQEEIPETAPQQKKELFKKTVSGIFDYLEMFAWSVLAVLLIFSFGLRLCRVDGESMENTLLHNQMLLLYSAGYTPKQDDIIVFHMTKPEANLQKTLVKRVIATGGQELVINTRTCEVTVDGIPYEDAHAILKNGSDQEIGYYYATLFRYGYDSSTGIFKATVPEDKIFVLGDNRNNSKDSRDPDVGFVDERSVLGKVCLRLSPFTVFS